MFSESDLLPLSGLQHLAFCERQWALIHLEQQWVENRLTVEGQQMHERAHEQKEEWREGVRVSRGLVVRSLRLGLTGVADVVEFRPQPQVQGQGKRPPRPYPVEYKRGRPKPGRCDEVQLCAQAMCLEEMTGVDVLSGAIFYGQPRRRTEVNFDTSLRAETEALSQRMHALYAARVTPQAPYAPKCDHCSLLEICLPATAGEGRSVAKYLKNALFAAMKEEDD
jgi:CRISPR-associated exonuclease Cas4